MLKYCIEKKAKNYVEDILRSLHGLQPAWFELQIGIGGKVFQPFAPVYSMFGEIRKKRVHVFALILSRKYSVLFSLGEYFKVKCDVVLPKRDVVLDCCSFPFGFFESYRYQ